MRAERADPRAAMAYWGQAMCYEQLLWGNEDVSQARAILARLRRSGALQRATPLERGWVATLDSLFGEGDRPSRLAAYAAAMEKLAAVFPDDPDVAAFHGLALMATRSRQFDAALERMRLRRLSVEGRARAAGAVVSSQASPSTPEPSALRRRAPITGAIALIVILLVRRMRKRRGLR